MFNNYSQWKRTIQVILCLYSLTFFLAFPLLFHERVFTVYYQSTADKTESNVLAENDERIKQATNYFEHIHPNTTLTYYKNVHNKPLDILITLVTVRRSQEPHFPIQVAHRVHQQIHHNAAIRAGFIICNVDDHPSSHKDATNLSTFFPTVIKPARRNHRVYEEEKQDYVFCLNKSVQFNSKFVLMLEDDSLPRRNMLPYLSYIIENKISHSVKHGVRIANNDRFLGVKLYYPLRWSGFDFSWRRMIDLVGICLIGVGLFPLVTVIWWWYFRIVYNLSLLYFIGFCGGLYVVLCGLLLGRQSLMDMFWLHPSLFRLAPAPGCCTPAVLYTNSEIGRLIEFLNSTKCTQEKGIDLVIDEYVETNKLKMYLVEPNLFRHIGFYSSLRGSGGSMKTPAEEFLFD